MAKHIGSIETALEDIECMYGSMYISLSQVEARMISGHPASKHEIPIARNRDDRTQTKRLRLYPLHHATASESLALAGFRSICRATRHSSDITFCLRTADARYGARTSVVAVSSHNTGVKRYQAIIGAFINQPEPR